MNNMADHPSICGGSTIELRRQQAKESAAVDAVQFSVQDGMTRHHSSSSNTNTDASSLDNFQTQSSAEADGSHSHKDRSKNTAVTTTMDQTTNGSHQPVSEDDDYEPLRSAASGSPALESQHSDHHNQNNSMMGANHGHMMGSDHARRPDDDADSHLSDIYQEAARAVLEGDLDLDGYEDQDFFAREMIELAAEAEGGQQAPRHDNETAADLLGPLVTRQEQPGNTAINHSGGHSVVSDDRSVPSTIDVPHGNNNGIAGHHLLDYQRTVPSPPPRLPRAALLPGLARPAIATAANLHFMEHQGRQNAQFSSPSAPPTSPVVSCRPATTGGTCVRAPSTSSLPASVSRPASATILNPAAHSANLISASSGPFKPGSTLTCAFCSSPGSDVRIGCAAGCTYHARCLDLESVASDPRNVRTPRENAPRGSPKEEVCVSVCPSCNGPAGGLSILPLDFGEMDKLQRRASEAAARLSSAANSEGGGAGATEGTGSTGASPALPMTTAANSGGAHVRRSVAAYDPNLPRTGRWTAEEIEFRDALIGHFLDGNLPLGNGLKLSDFMPGLLKSKQSRLAKKMKNAK